MVLLGWIVRIVLLLLIVRGLVRLLAGFFEGLRGMPPSQPAARGASRGGRQAVPLVKDPVCGTYVVSDRALTAAAGGTTHYFCSEDCRRRFEQSRKASRTA